MKKVLFALLIIVGLSYSSMGQMDTVSGPDGRVSEWYFSFWYDTCFRYWEDTPRPSIRIFEEGAGSVDYCYYGKPEYVPRPAALTGVGVWVAPYPVHPWGYADSISKLPEYIYVVQKGKDTMIWLERVRWDTAECRVLKIPINYDSARHGFRYCHLYTAYFDKPVEVDSIYYLFGSHFSNIIEGNMVMHRWTSYASVHNSSGSLADMSACRMWYPLLKYMDSNAPYPQQRNTYTAMSTLGSTKTWGFFMPIIEFVSLRVESSDSTKGTAGQSGDASPNTWQTIWARAKSGYRFSHWNDGDTNNPRQIRLMHDTLFTAYFTSSEQCTVSVSSNTTMGHVDGGGVYYIGDSVVLTAVPNVINYHFVQWNDSVTANPRIFVATQDTSFKAFFERDEPAHGIGSPDTADLFTLTPNPAYRSVTVRLQAPVEGGRLALHNAEGRELWGGSLATGQNWTVLDLSPYPSGVYFVTFTYGESTTVRKLIIGE